MASLGLKVGLSAAALVGGGVTCFFATKEMIATMPDPAVWVGLLSVVSAYTGLIGGHSLVGHFSAD